MALGCCSATALTITRILEALYHRRPSVWIEPQGDWGKGSVQLIEIPSEAERYDNIAAFWTPEKPVEPGQPLEYSYRLSFFLILPNLSPGGRTLFSRIGAAARRSESSGGGLSLILVARRSPSWRRGCAGTADDQQFQWPNRKPGCSPEPVHQWLAVSAAAARRQIRWICAVSSNWAIMS